VARLLHWFVQHHAGDAIAIDLFPHHESATALASGLGFRPVRRLTRMVRKPSSPSLPDAQIYAIAGFEYG
jgi:hypothetical protein